MSCYEPKRKTATGTEEVTIPISCIKGLPEELDELGKKKIAMPMIRLTNAGDAEGTMLISPNNPLRLTVEIIDGQLQVGDEVQICTRQLVTYHSGSKRKYRLRKQWRTLITDKNVDDRFITVAVSEGIDTEEQRLFKTGAESGNTLSTLYIRVRRPVYKAGVIVDGLFSNVVTVLKRHSATGKIFIK